MEKLFELIKFYRIVLIHLDTLTTYRGITYDIDNFCKMLIKNPNIEKDFVKTYFSDKAAAHDLVRKVVSFSGAKVKQIERTKSFNATFSDLKRLNLVPVMNDSTGQILFLSLEQNCLVPFSVRKFRELHKISKDNFEKLLTPITVTHDEKSPEGFDKDNEIYNSLTHAPWVF